MIKRGKQKKAIILIIVLWVMFFLSVVVLVLGAKNRMNVRLRSLNNESLRMFYLAKEGVNRAIDILVKDDLAYDALSEDWGQKISLEQDSGTVNIQIIDENRFININNVSEEILNNLKTFFPEITVEQVALILKNRPFDLKSEVIDLLALDGTGSAVDQFNQTRLIDLLTTFSNGMLNINTVSEAVLGVIPGMTDSAVQSIIAHRQSNPFVSNDELSAELSLIGLTPAQVSSLIKCVKVNSNAFRILVNAQSKERHIAQSLEVVVGRHDNKLDILLSKEN
ncbi:MAG: general secretion pathway protein GspK [Candidatus Omnitrophica bacterium]|nr:general secretion pathway protein GspK [Candidatus Omnitrophota bacterium]